MYTLKKTILKFFALFATRVNVSVLVCRCHKSEDFPVSASKSDASFS